MARRAIFETGRAREGGDIAYALLSTESTRSRHGVEARLTDLGQAIADAAGAQRRVLTRARIRAELSVPDLRPANILAPMAVEPVFGFATHGHGGRAVRRGARSVAVGSAETEQARSARADDGTFV
jgi:hypothetical protein